jgi:hypothetical protein
MMRELPLRCDRSDAHYLECRLPCREWRGWKVVPDTGHPMGLQNPAGFARAIAETFAGSGSANPSDPRNPIPRRTS